MVKKILHIKITLKYKNKVYTFIDDHSDYNFDGVDIPSEFWWEEGNGACDCNRSLFIQRHCDPTFPEMKCSNEIELISQEFIGDWRKDG